MPAPIRTLGCLALIVMAGLATGILTQFGQSVLPDGWNRLANAISPWLLIAFIVGSLMPSDKWALAAGPTTLLLALAGYYATIAIRYDSYPSLSGALVFWAIGAVVGGPVFAVAGRWWRGDVAGRRATALGLLGAATVAEGIYFIVVLGNPGVGIAAVVLGLLIPLALGRSNADRRWGLVAEIPWVALGLVGYGVFLGLYGFLT